MIFMEKIVLIVMSGKGSVLVSILKYASYFAVYYSVRCAINS